MADAPIISEGGGKLPGFGEDFLQRIVGVNWPRREGGGLAVDFGDGAQDAPIVEYNH